MVRSDMHDSRLIGVWRSDARKTSIDITSRRDLSLAKNKKKYQKLMSLFGKLELRYTRTLCHSRLGNYESAAAYKVVAKDENSVALVSVQPLVGKQIVHIHFEGRRYWVYLGSSGLREFFKRAPAKRPSGKPIVQSAR